MRNDSIIDNPSIKVAINSLEQALETYYSSCKLISIELWEKDIIYIRYNEYSTYTQLYFKVIIYMEHFFEILLREILRQKTMGDIEKFYHIIEECKKEKILKNYYTNNLHNLRKERNKLWHEGNKQKTIDSMSKDEKIQLFNEGIKINKLDELMCKRLLPIVKYLFNNNLQYNYSENRYLQRLDELVDVSKNHINYNKLFIIKELGVAQLKSPIFERLMIPSINGITNDFTALFRQAEKDELGRLASAYEEMACHLQSSNSNKYKILEQLCPICKSKTMISYYEHECEEVAEQRGVVNVYKYVNKIECICCHFRIPARVGNPKDIGFDKMNFEFEPWESYKTKMLI